MKVAFLTTDSREHFQDYKRGVPYFGTAPDALLEGFKMVGEPQVHVISCAQARMSSPKRLEENIWFHELHVPKWGWLRTCYWGCIRAVRRKFAEIQPDLVHAQGTERDCAIEAVTSQYPNLITVHGNIRSVAKTLRASIFSYYWFQARLESFTLKRTDGILCNSRYTESKVLALNHKTYMLPNAVRKIFFETPRQSSRPMSAGLQLLMVGAITPYKQPLEVLRFLRILRQRPNFPLKKCLWAGRADPTHSYARQFLEELDGARSEGWAEHFQNLAPDLLIKKMDESDALLHVPTEEAFGLVVAEAMVRGLPVIAAKTGGLQDFEPVYPKIRLVPSHPSLEWQEALTPDFCRGGRVPLNAWPSQLYTPKHVASKHLEIYREVITSK